jgi:F0F1-type ATP synthase assembly protein I
MDKPQKENQSPTQGKNNLKKKPVRQNGRVQAYAKYSGMAVQLGGTIAIGAFIGRKLDQYFALEKPLLTAFFALAATVGGIYLLINGLINKNDQ